MSAVRVAGGRPAEELSSYALRRVYELQGAFLRFGTAEVRAEAIRRRDECRRELARRGETIYVDPVTL